MIFFFFFVSPVPARVPGTESALSERWMNREVTWLITTFVYTLRCSHVEWLC